jgi:HK97 family phage major capsid protein
MSMVRAKKLREQAGRLWHEGKALLDTVEKESREMSGDELQRHQEILDKSETLVNEAEAIERQERARVSESSADPEPRGEVDPDEVQRDVAPEGRASRDSDTYSQAFRRFLSHGMERLDTQQRSALQVDVDDVGGFVSASYRLVDGVIKELKDKLVMLQYARVYPSRYGETIGQLGMTSHIGDLGWVGEITDAETKDSVKWHKRELKPRLIEPFIVPISIYLLRNAQLNVEAEVAEVAADAQAVTIEKASMVGDGVHKPLGVFTASSEGISTDRDSDTDMGSTAITGDGLIEAQDMLDEFYQPRATWLFHRKAITQIRKLKNDVSGDYIWQPGLRAGEPNTILGRPYITATYVPNTFTSGKYVGLYGDLSQYAVAMAENMEIQRLDQQPYAGKSQVGFLFRNVAVDGMPRREDAFVRLKLD